MKPRPPRIRLNPVRRLVAVGLTLALAPWAQLAADEANAELRPEPALRQARAYLALRHPQDHRPIVAARYIPPHGDTRSTGFWLVELAPYDPAVALPAATLTGLLIDANGTIRERGGRQPVDPAETARIRDHAERLGKMMEAKKTGKPVTATPAPTP